MFFPKIHNYFSSSCKSVKNATFSLPNTPEESQIQRKNSSEKKLLLPSDFFGRALSHHDSVSE